MEKIVKQFFVITKTDALSFLLFVIPFVSVFIGVSPFIFGDISLQRSFGRISTITTESSHFYFLFALYVTPFVLALYILRILLILNIILKGKRVNGIVTEIHFIKDRGIVVYEYRVGDFIYRTVNRIMKSRLTLQFRKGSMVHVCFDQKNPRKAFIKELYSIT